MFMWFPLRKLNLKKSNGPKTYSALLDDLDDEIYVVIDSCLTFL